jgi:dihydrofolate synthase/folylpolyglutamate synthase
MDYPQTLEYLERIAASGIKLGLENIHALLKELGSPQEKVPAVHIAGSNGKGSVAAFLSSILAEAGYRVGTYTSPHLVDVEERIAVDGRPLAPELLAEAATFVKIRVDRLLESRALRREPTYFEFLTAVAFHVFAREECDVAVAEAGLGGRLDATNVISRPLVCIITRIDTEHTEHLGSTLPEIAREKAGICRAGVPTLTFEKDPGTLAALRDAARAAGSTLVPVAAEFEATTGEDGNVTIRTGRARFPDLAVPLPGEHQVENLALALRAVDLLTSRGFAVDLDQIRMGVQNTRWPGRLEVVRTNPTVLLDGAHNPAGARALAAYLDTLNSGGDLYVVFGAMKDKDIPGIMAPILPRARKVFLTRASLDRAAPTEVLAEHARGLHDDLVTLPDPGSALDGALAEARDADTVLVAGSLVLIGDVKRHLGA